MSDLRVIIVNLYDITPKFIAALNKLVGSGYVDNSVSKLLYEQNAVHYIAVISKNLTLEDALSLKKPLLGFVTLYETMDAVVLENLCTSKPYNGIAAQIIRESTVKVSEERNKPVLLFVDKKAYPTETEFKNIINFYLGQMIGDNSDLPLFRHCQKKLNQRCIDSTNTKWSLGKKYTYKDVLIHYPIAIGSTSSSSHSSSSETNNQIPGDDDSLPSVSLSDKNAKGNYSNEGTPAKRNYSNKSTPVKGNYSNESTPVKGNYSNESTPTKKRRLTKSQKRSIKTSTIPFIAESKSTGQPKLVSRKGTPNLY